MSQTNYADLWKTLMQTGTKQRFSQIRQEFFTTIARDGRRIYQGEDDMNNIVNNSKVFKDVPKLVEALKRGIGPNDKFKHHEYHTDDGELWIEYFANVSSPITTAIAPNASVSDDFEVDGYCNSVTVKSVVDDGVDKYITVHLILIGEGPDGISPIEYPKIIKHELTHACVFETRVLLDLNYFSTIKLPSTWTDDDMENWQSNIDKLKSFYNDGDSEDVKFFNEFVADFLMFESDGQTKEANPIKEDKNSKVTKSDAKPKITYRTLTPFDRFQEHVEFLPDIFAEKYQIILNDLRPLYDDYDKFLDDIKM